MQHSFYSFTIILSAVLIPALFCSVEGSTVQRGSDSIPSLDFHFDFLFRGEQDWDSRRSDGTFREDRFRLRYRFRTGTKISLGSGFSLGTRIRTGILEDQQGSPLTLGRAGSEFEPVQIAMDRLYLRYERNKFWIWLGKNDFPHWQQNQLFWSSNVHPDGAALGYQFLQKQHWNMEGRTGYFIVSSEDGSLTGNPHLISFSTLSEYNMGGFTWKFHPAFYSFNELSNLPDGLGTFSLSYQLLQLNSAFVIQKGAGIHIGADLMLNLKDYDNNSDITSAFSDEKTGIALNLKYGTLSKKGDFSTGIYLTRIEKYAIVDYFAQNDWGRWDYSSIDSPAARLSNYKGFQLMGGYQITDKVKALAKFFLIEQLKSNSPFNESGSRVRLEIRAEL